MKRTFLLLALLFLGVSAKLFGQNTYKGTVAQIRALTGTTYQVAASTDDGTGNWYMDTADTTTPDNTGTVLVDAGGHRWKRIYSGAIYVNWFGAKPDDGTDDGPAIQACFNNAVAHQTVGFSKGTYNITSTVTLSTTDVNLTGERANIVGTINIGDGTARTFNSVISGFTFTAATAGIGNALQIQNCRKLEIVSNVFNNYDKAVYIKAGVTATHVNGIIEIKNNFFNDVNYCFYADRAAAATWQVNNDCTFSGNVGNNVLITAVYCNGMDGLKYNNNTIFMPSDAARRGAKMHHLQIDNQSDWVIVANNNFFESGTESILVENCKMLNASGNNFAWCGQRNFFSVIKGTGTITDLIYNVSGNSFDGFSGHVIELAGTTSGMVNATGNTVNYSNTFTNYFGSDNLAADMHYIVFSSSAVTKIFEKNNFNVIDNLKSSSRGSVVSKYEQWGNFAAQSYVAKTATVADTVNYVNLLGLLDANMSSSTYGGSLIVSAKNSAASNANTTTYFLQINRAASAVNAVVTWTALGLTAGAGASHPSFKFAIDNTTNKLQVKAINNTRGTFFFYTVSQGDLVVVE